MPLVWQLTHFMKQLFCLKNIYEFILSPLNAILTFRSNQGNRIVAFKDKKRKSIYFRNKLTMRAHDFSLVYDFIQCKILSISVKRRKIAFRRSRVDRHNRIPQQSMCLQAPLCLVKKPKLPAEVAQPLKGKRRGTISRSTIRKLSRTKSYNSSKPNTRQVVFERSTVIYLFDGQGRVIN